MKVGSKSDPNKVAGMFTSLVRKGCTTIDVGTIGAGASHQLLKSVAIAKGYLASTGLTLWVSPAFGNTVIDGQDKTTLESTVIAVRTQ